MSWDGRWYRSLSVVALAAERAAHAGRFDPYRSEFVMEWPNQERRYNWYDEEAIHDTRCYGFPARAVLAVHGNDRFHGEVRIIADSNRHDDGPPTVRILARGVAGESVRAAFQAARDTLSDEALSGATPYDILEIKAAERLERSGVSRHPAAIAQRAKRILDAIEAHPAFVALLGIIIGAVVAFLVR
jgi:hypothetical protein